MKRKHGFSGERLITLPPMVVEQEIADPLVSSLYVTDIGYYPHAEGHFCQRNEPIAEHVLIYCVDGMGWYEVEGKRHTMTANHFFVLPAGKSHTYGADEDNPWTIYWVHFSGSHATIYASGALQPQEIRPNMRSRINYRNQIFEEIFNTLYNGCSQESLRYVSSLLHYYLASMRYINSYRQAEERSDSDSTVSAAIHYMQENIEKRLTLQDLAKYTGYSPTHFSALFKQQIGDSPLGYFNRLKIDASCQMLSETDMYINQICHKVGIPDCYYFSRLFHRIVGVTPRQYRLRQRQQ
ncbi:MAG: AraC family transcriptional regulator [Prevotellaceae bacterium]|nr:AraC family transcriptional regulator [Prevotellaceae bacterium]